MKSSFILVIAVVLLGVLIWFLDTMFPGRLGDDFTISHVLYLIAVLAILGPGVWASNRGNPRRAVLYGAIWVALLAGVFILYSFRDTFTPIVARLQSELIPSSAQVNAQGELVLKRGEDSHFYADAYVNGERIYFMVDTGASRVALSYDDARRIGIDMDALKYTMPVNTANGLTMNAYIRLDSVAIQPFVVEDVRASVAKQGQLTHSLLGMSFLDALGGYRVEGDRMILWR